MALSELQKSLVAKQAQNLDLAKSRLTDPVWMTGRDADFVFVGGAGLFQCLAQAGIPAVAFEVRDEYELTSACALARKQLGTVATFTPAGQNPSGTRHYLSHRTWELFLTQARMLRASIETIQADSPWSPQSPALAADTLHPYAGSGKFRHSSWRDADRALVLRKLLVAVPHIGMPELAQDVRLAILDFTRAIDQVPAELLASQDHRSAAQVHDFLLGLIIQVEFGLRRILQDRATWDDWLAWRFNLLAGYSIDAIASQAAMLGTGSRADRGKHIPAARLVLDRLIIEAGHEIDEHAVKTLLAGNALGEASTLMAAMLARPESSRKDAASFGLPHHAPGKTRHLPSAVLSAGGM